MLKIFTSKPWRSTHHTLGHVATAAWQVFPRQCFHLVLLPVTDLIHYLTFLLPPLETQQDTTYLSRLCFPLHFSSPSHQKTEHAKEKWSMDNIKPISIFIPYESQKWYTVCKLHLISDTFSWQESVGTVCRSKEITRIAKFVYLRGVVGLLQDFFSKALPRAKFSC